jgi:hypothetical protein
MAVLSFIVKFIGWPATLLIVFYVYEEGIPGAARIPFLSSVPIIGDLTTGRVHSHAADQVRIATAQQKAVCDARLEKNTSAFENLALKAQLDEEQRLRSVAEAANTEAQKRATAARAAATESDARLEELLMDAQQTKGVSYPTKEDEKWLDSHR